MVGICFIDVTGGVILQSCRLTLVPDRNIIKMFKCVSSSIAGYINKRTAMQKQTNQKRQKQNHFLL